MLDVLLERYRFEPILVRLTSTMLDKAIMDARAPLRAYLRSRGLVDYGLVGQGPDAKVQLVVPFVAPGVSEERTVSFYRPLTKGGDPRVWVERMGSVAAPDDLLVFAFLDSSFILILLKGGIEALSETVGTLLPSRYEGRAKVEQVVARLMEAVRPYRSKWVRTMRAGPTGIGFTLETILGIPANVRQAADIEGVELKAYRRGARTGQKLVTLFSKTPRWATPEKGLGLLNEHGYWDESKERRQLYCTITTKANTLGFSLAVLPEGGRVDVLHGGQPVASYDLGTLAKRLREKHPATLFVRASSRGRGAAEEFLYEEVVLCREPSFANFLELIELADICLDFTLSERTNGTCRDHGYLWRVKEHAISQLYAYRKALA